jgi:hypothetical protein
VVAVGGIDDENRLESKYKPYHSAYGKTVDEARTAGSWHLDWPAYFTLHKRTTGICNFIRAGKHPGRPVD